MGSSRWCASELPAGAVNFEIRYADYHDIGGVMFAYKVDADFPAAQTRVSFVYKRPIVNGAIADSVFTLTPGPDAKQVDLGMMPSVKGSSRWLSCVRADHCRAGGDCDHRMPRPARERRSREAADFLQASMVGDPRTFNPVLATDSQFRRRHSTIFSRAPS